MEGNGIPAFGEISRGLIGSLESPLTAVHALDNITSASPPLADASGILSLTQLPSTCTYFHPYHRGLFAFCFLFFLPDVSFRLPISFSDLLTLDVPTIEFFRLHAIDSLPQQTQQEDELPLRIEYNYQIEQSTFYFILAPI